MKNLRVLRITIFTILFSFSISFKSFADMTNYCALPPFLVSAVPPNILLVLDKSGSMSARSYSGDEGYFNPAKHYRFEYNGDSNGNGIVDFEDGIWVETNSPTTKSCYNQPTKILKDLNNYHLNNQGSEPVYTGSCLDKIFMTRMDLLRWALTGGRPDSCSNHNIYDENCDPDLACNGSTCILRTVDQYYGKHFKWNNHDYRFKYTVKVKVPKERVKGIIQYLEEETIQPRLGAMFYSKQVYGDKIYIGDYPNGNDADPTHPYTYIKRAINSIEPSGATATAVALWEAYDYFKQSNDHHYKNGFTFGVADYQDPMKFCDYQKENCQLVPCAKNFIILVSDGQWNNGGNPNFYGGVSKKCSINSGYESNSADPVVPTYWLHAKDLRTLTTISGNEVPMYVDTVYSMGVFLGGTGEQSLKNLAVYGSFDRTKIWPDGTDGSHWNGVGKHYPWDTCYMDDCGNGRGSACTPLPPSSLDWDKNNDGIPDTFTSAKSAIEIKESLLAFIKDILKKTSSGSAVSILSEKNKKSSIVYQAVFYPEKSFEGKTTSWIGYLYSYWFLNTPKVQNLREDTNENKILDLEEDLILEFALSNGSLKLYAYDSDATGRKSSTSPVITYSSLDDIHPLWESGKLLLDRNPDTRKIYTVSKSNNKIEFTTGNIGNLDIFLGDPDNFPTCLIGTTDEQSYENLISYIRGEDINGCRNRTTNNGNVWKLGDIIYSTPEVVDYPDYSVVFVGSNDGMLHAFKSGKVKFDNGKYRLCNTKDDCNTDELGQELWSFIPKNALPYLRYLADPDYANCHIYIVDGTPYTFNIDTNHDGHPEKRILIGGFRLGGGCSTDITPPSDTCSDPSDSDCVGLSSYFALDITNPEDPQFLWEFTHQNLGFSFSGPAHITYNGNHYVMFLSGPTTYKGESSQNLNIFVLSLDSDMTLDDVTTLSSSTLSNFNNSFGGRLYTEGVDYDDDGNTDFVFFGVNKNTGSVWQGNVLAVKINNTDPSNWEVKKIFNSAIEPVTAKVEYMKCFDMNYIYFGTGRWFYKTDEEGTNNSDVEHLYGVRIDDCIAGNCNVNAAHNSTDACSELLNENKNVAWKIDLEPKNNQYFKERNIADPTGSPFNIIFFSTTQPNADICGFGGHSRVWGLNCATGDAITSECKETGGPDYSLEYETIKNFTLFLQLSGGNIEQIKKNSFNNSTKVTPWYEGITPESGATLGVPNVLEGEIILWLEK